MTEAQAKESIQSHRNRLDKILEQKKTEEGKTGVEHENLFEGIDISIEELLDLSMSQTQEIENPYATYSEEEPEVVEQSQILTLPTIVEPAMVSLKRQMPAGKSIPSAKSVQTTMNRYIPYTKGGVRKIVKKKRKFNLSTYRMMMNADELCDFDVDEYVDNNKKKLRNKGSRMLARVMKYFTCGTFFPKNWNDQHMLMTMVCVFNKFYSTKNIIAVSELNTQQKDYLMNKIKELAPQSFYEFWNSIVSSTSTNELSNASYVDRICRYMQNSEDDYSCIIKL